MKGDLELSSGGKLKMLLKHCQKHQKCELQYLMALACREGFTCCRVQEERNGVMAYSSVS